MAQYKVKEPIFTDNQTRCSPEKTKLVNFQPSQGLEYVTEALYDQIQKIIYSILPDCKPLMDPTFDSKKKFVGLLHSVEKKILGNIKHIFVPKCTLELRKESKRKQIQMMALLHALYEILHQLTSGDV